MTSPKDFLESKTTPDEPEREKVRDTDEYQPRTTGRLIEILTAKGVNPRSWEAEAARALHAAEKRAEEAERERDEARKCISEMEARPYPLSGDSNRLFRYLN